MLAVLWECWLPILGLTIPVAHQQRLLPPSGEEAGRRSLTDGRGICRAFDASPNSHKTPMPLFLPSVAFGPVVQSSQQALPCPLLVSLPACGSLTPSALCPPGTRFPPAPSASGRSLFNLPRSQLPPSGVVPRSAEGTRRRPKRAACGREGTLPRKPRQRLSSSCANAPPPR